MIKNIKHTIEVGTQQKSPNNNLLHEKNGKKNDMSRTKALFQIDTKKIKKNMQFMKEKRIDGSKSRINQKQQQGKIDALGFKTWIISERIIHQTRKSIIKKAIHRNTGEIAAVKIIQQSQESVRSSTTHQIQALKRMKQHNNIITYFDNYIIDGKNYIFMEYVAKSLKDFIEVYSPIDHIVYMRIIRQIIQAIKHLQENHIYHKDIKCSNILINSDGIVKLADFGYCKMFTNTQSQEQYNQCRGFRGTVLWMAPETISQQTFNVKSDIWGLGCTLIELVTGKTPWDEYKFQNELAAIYLIGQNKHIPQYKQQIHEDIQVLIQNCLQNDPEKRLSASQLLELKLWEKYALS